MRTSSINGRVAGVENKFGRKEVTLHVDRRIELFVAIKDILAHFFCSSSKGLSEVFVSRCPVDRILSSNNYRSAEGCRGQHASRIVFGKL